MCRVLLPALVGLLLCGSAAAQTEKESIRIAVVDLASNGVRPELASTLTSVLAAELNRLRVFSVVSNQDVRAMMSHDALIQLAGCDGSSHCSSNLLGALGARYLVSGNVGLIGNSYTLNFVLTDVTKGSVEGRASATVDDPVKLLDAATRSSHVLVSKVLSTRQATLLVTCSEPGATVKVDGQIVGNTPLPRLEATWGPHLIEVEKTGFITTQEDVSVQGEIVDRHYQLTPSQEFLKQYESKAVKMRVGAWTTTSLAAASLGAALGFQFYHQRIANDFINTRTAYESNPTQPQYDHLTTLHNQAHSAIEATYALTGVGLALGGAALYFWIAGENPSKYSSYRQRESSPAPPVAFHFLDQRGLASLTW